jgi:hypothetical protein
MVARSTEEKGWMYCTIALVLIKSTRLVRCGATKGLSNKVGWTLAIAMEHGLRVAYGSFLYQGCHFAVLRF